MNFVLRNQSEDASETGAVCFDSYCAHLGINHIDLLKIDIEGGEYDALLGARKLLADRSVGCIFMELTEWAARRSGHTTMEISNLLAEHGYRIFSVSKRAIQPVPEHLLASVNEFVVFPEQRTHTPRVSP